jgi:hypothetical protein
MTMIKPVERTARFTSLPAFVSLDTHPRVLSRKCIILPGSSFHNALSSQPAVEIDNQAFTRRFLFPTFI